jgi:hypothetical protein
MSIEDANGVFDMGIKLKRALAIAGTLFVGITAVRLGV